MRCSATRPLRGLLATVRFVVADVGTAKSCAALLKAESLADILVNDVAIYGPQDFFGIPDVE